MASRFGSTYIERAIYLSLKRREYLFDSMLEMNKADVDFLNLVAIWSTVICGEKCTLYTDNCSIMEYRTIIHFKNKFYLLS
jgi:hypothetical protein